MKLTLTAAMETLIDLPPLHLVIQGEARLGIYRLQNELRNVNIRSGHTNIVNLVRGNELNTNSDHTKKRYAFNIPFKVIISSREERINQTPRMTQQGHIWYTDGSKTADGTGAGIYSRQLRNDLSYRLEQYNSVFQAEIYAILQCARHQ